MILNCPVCATRYEVPPGSIPPQGRPVKCASCHHSWMASGQSQASTFMPEGRAHRNQTGNQSGNQPRNPSFQAKARAGSTFSRPVRSSPVRNQGGAALAALFDMDEVEADHFATRKDDLSYYGEADIIETDWTEVAAAPIDSEALERSIDEALSTPAIARLVARQEQAPAGPPAASGASLRPVPSSASLSEPAGPAGTENADGAPSAAVPDPGPPTGPVTRMARGVIALLSRGADLLDTLLNTLLGARQPQAESMRTPGDRKVSEWRQQQFRRARRRMTPAKFLGWTALVLTAGAIGVSAILFREAVAATWPQAGAAYQAAGLVGQPDPLDLVRVQHRYARSPQGPVVELLGTVSHHGDQPVPAPLVRADALGPEGTLLASWAFALEGPGRLSPQSETPFRTRALAPAGTLSVRVSLMSPADRADLEQDLPEVITALEGGAGANAFFMRRTTSGWGEAAEPTPVTSRIRE